MNLAADHYEQRLDELRAEIALIKSDLHIREAELRHATQEAEYAERRELNLIDERDEAINAFEELVALIGGVEIEWSNLRGYQEITNECAERLKEYQRPWRPIEAAPIDGSSILVYLEDELLRSRIHSARLHPNIKIVGGQFSFDAPKMTHWMPQPAPPEDANAKG